jgi:hypothetical protein
MRTTLEARKELLNCCETRNTLTGSAKQSQINHETECRGGGTGGGKSMEENCEAGKLTRAVGVGW